jgi:hypothetical protein
MELPIIILLVCILLMQVLTCWSVIAIEKWLAILTNIEPEKTDEPAKVTDPFSKPAEVYSSTSHIIVPKTPTEIRNQNFKRIQNGEEYGDPIKR